MADTSLQDLEGARSCNPQGMNKRCLIKTVLLLQKEYGALEEDLSQHQQVANNHSDHVAHLREAIEALREQIRNQGALNADQQAVNAVQTLQLKRLGARAARVME